MDYLIKVRSLNEIDGDVTKQEIITHASLSGDKDDYTVVYTEETDGFPAETTIRVLKGECVTVRRKAEMQTDMIIEAGIKHISEHKLSFGCFQLEVIGKSISSDFGENGVELKFSYATYQDNMPVSKSDFHIRVKRKGITLREEKKNVKNCK